MNKGNILRKNLASFAIALVLLLSSVGALADDGSGTQGVDNLPAEVSAYINTSRWSGWEVTGWVNPGGTKTNSACAFAVVKNGSKNDLLAFGWQDGGWVYKWRNDEALPQVKDPIVLGEGIDGKTFFSSYVVDGSILEAHSVWVQRDDGTWHLNHLSCYNPLMFYDTSVPGVLRVYNTGWTSKDTDVKVYGTYQTELRYFNFYGFPKTVKDAREKLSNPPKIPSGTLSAKKIQFTGGKKYDVYQGPGQEYGRAGSGKAVVSTNDWIQVFGEENGWIMIQYDITSDHMRIGWIAADALPGSAKVTLLRFTPILATATRQVTITDDPLFSLSAVGTLPQGTQINWLATMGDWAYIELAGVQMLRGFVPMSALSTVDALNGTK